MINAPQKSGIEYSTSNTYDVIRSNHPPRRAACAVPTTTPMMKLRRRPSPANASVRGSASARAVATDSFLNVEYPRCPCATLHRYRPYWTMSGLSYPKRARHSARTAGVMRAESYENGSPGAERMTKNAIVVTMKTTTTDCPRRAARRRRTISGPTEWRSTGFGRGRSACRARWTTRPDCATSRRREFGGR